ISKKSIDARDKGDVKIVLSIEFECVGAPPKPPASVKECVKYPPVRPASLSNRPVIVGMGPAGLFAGYILSKAGARPVIIERGKPVDERERDVSLFWSGGELNRESNVQFGEGGAGAFSDGKLNSGISDSRCRFVLETFHAHGAPDEILYQSRPHVGTDVLPRVVKSMREEMLSLGADIRFSTKLEDIISDRGVRGIVASGAQIETDNVILAIGHSARDTFELLFRLGVDMKSKSFSVGARIEHLQSSVNKTQYGRFATELAAAEYRLNVKSRSGRGVYTFCMCPGGYVVAAASEPGGVVTNGMSYFKRDGLNANSALLVSVDPSDFGSGALAGVEFQRKWERAAYSLSSSYLAPAQRVGDFLKRVESKSPGDVMPTYRPGVVYASLDEVLPTFVTDAMREGIVLMDRRLRGFAAPGAVLTGVETRSSSPVRILRDPATLQSNIPGLYPCGEGAGYAGGIMSSAVDGIRAAEAVIGRG
ncbi:MAG: hypothetical protein Q4D04_14025, partial [Clostridia bacterium]|nr:hypothetical protein [Clostridia bacterium]